MKTRLSVVILSVILSGCAAQPADFSWYHPLGGEHLFAYDRNACEAHVTDQGLKLSTDLSGPFFQCMHERGYYLLDGDRIVQAPLDSTFEPGTSVTQN